MNIPKWAQWPLAAIWLLGVVGVAANGVKNNVDRALILQGTPEQAEATIRAKFTDPSVQAAALESFDRRLQYIAGKYGHVLSVSGSYYLDAEHWNSIFPEWFDHSQRAQVENRRDDGTTELIDIDLTEVPQDITDNSRQVIEGAGQ